MTFACQKDSYLKEIETTVRSCESAERVHLVNGKKEKQSGYEVILEDTVLFPEGGGQPDDRGKINDMEVLSVVRRGADAVHFTLEHLAPGTNVRVVVDWERRLDHMQQHSGQHLITAIATDLYGYETTSWSLGEKVSTVELDTPTVSEDQMKHIERVVNDKIRESISVSARLYNDKNDPELIQFRTRGLPEDHVGSVRIVTIDGIEADMCCGTHVSNLCHLQVIKLLCAEKGKRNKTNVTFVCGQRVLSYLNTCYDRERAFNTYLQGQPENYVDLLQKLHASLRLAQKNATTLLRDVARFEAERIKEERDRTKNGPALQLFTLHRKEGDNEFMNTIANEVGCEVILFLTTGDEKGSGLFLLSGPEDFVKQLGPKVAELLDGRGAGKLGRYQGKANRLKKRADVEQLLRDHCALCCQSGDN